jgi:peptidoglycan/LPS O-acetylase OafA/YrhL
MSGSDAPGLSARPSATGKERITALDGIRAFALLIIMGYHFGLGWLSGGFFSLDIFYVLSGYLITGLLLGEYRRRDRIKLSNFWLRRARRLLPALLIVLVAVTLMVRFAEPAGLYPDFRMSALSALFYFSNWWQIAVSGSYFVATGPLSPLTHTWSLAVEEQFYLVWPFVVLAVMGLARTFARGIRALLALSLVGAVASAVEMALLYNPSSSTNTTRIYFGTDTHAQSILVGAVLACALTMIQMRRGEEGMDPAARTPLARGVLVVSGVAGLAALVVLSSVLDGSSSLAYRGGFALCAASAAAVITAVVCVPGGPLAQVLSWRPLVWVGTVSYGAYLWHYPIFIYLDGARTGLQGLSLLAVRSAATFGLAAASFYLVERPVIEGTFWRSIRAVVPAIALVVATVVVVVSGTLVSSASAAPFAPTPVQANRAEWKAYQVHNFNDAGRRVTVLMVGDSLSLTVAIGISPYAQQYGVDLGGRSHTGCGIAVALPLDDHGAIGDPFPNCPTWPTWWADDVRQLHPQVVGLLIGFWEVQDRWLDGRWQHIGEPGYDAYETAQLERAVSILSSQGARVALFTSPYFDSGEQPDGMPWPQDSPARVDRLNQIIEAVARRDPGVVRVIPLNTYLDPAGHFAWKIDGQVVRQPDGVHTTLAGGTYLAPKILPQLAALGRSA